MLLKPFQGCDERRENVAHPGAKIIREDFAER
jgi:hypothetical protein